MFRIFSLFCLLLCYSSYSFSVSATEQINDQSFSQQIQPLTKNKLKKLPGILEQLTNTNDPRVETLLTELLNGRLFYIKANKQIVYVEKQLSKEYKTWDLLTGESLTAQTKSSIKKIRTNNSSRRLIKGYLALLSLSAKDKDIRLQAVNRIISEPSTKAIDRLINLLPNETDDDVKDAMQIAIAVTQLNQGTEVEKRIAIQTLKDSLEPNVKNALVKALEELSDNSSKELKADLESAIGKIEQSQKTYQIIENLFFGLSLGSVFLLAAIGLAITFGVMGVINMAHGEMIMLGAYTTYVIQQVLPNLIEYSLFIAIPAAFIVAGLVGILIERGVIRFLKGRPLETLLATFGISLILQQLVRTIFSPLNRQVYTPEWMSGSWEINPIFSLTYNRLYIIAFALVVFFALMLLLKKSSLGLHVRAVSQNRDMARSLSIRSDWVDAMTFGLGSGIAGIAGVVLSQLTNVGPNLGQAYIIDSFLVVVFGGVGNLWGTLVAAMSLGSLNKFLEPLTGSVLANIIVLVGLVLFIQKRPKGLFPQKGRSAD